MKNKILFSTVLAGTLSALAADAKTVVTPIARTLNPATYYSATTLVVPTGSVHNAEMPSLIPLAFPVNSEESKLAVEKSSIRFSLDFRPISYTFRAYGVPILRGQESPGTSSLGLPVPASVSPPDERTRVKHFARKTGVKEKVVLLDDFVRQQRESHRKQLAAIKKRRAPGRQFILPLDHNSVRVCIAARPARVPLAAHKVLPRPGIATKYAMPLTKADIERKNERAKEYRLAYVRKSRHLRKLSPDMIAKFKFYPPLRHFDTDVLVVATAPTQPVMAYVPVPTEEKILYASAPAAGVYNTIEVAASATDEVIGTPSHEFCVTDITMNGNVPSKTGINGMFYAQAEFVEFYSKAHNGLFDQPVALRNVPRAGLHQVTYDELGHSPPVCRV